jgi:PAS domain S-box-containing protein
VAHVNPDGRWLRLNPKFCEIVGYTQEELLKIRFQDITHPDDLAADVAQAEKIVAGQSDPVFNGEALSSERRVGGLGKLDGFVGSWRRP